mgnify:CR=1 FL=1
MLEVQKYLTSSGACLEDLKLQYGISIKHSEDHPELVMLEYSPVSDMSNPICQECRGLILERGTFGIVCKTFNKFFNYYEPEAYPVLQKMDWASVRVLEKMDGSLIQVYSHNDEWRMSTSGTINAFKAGVNRGKKTFGGLFLEALEYQGTSWEELTGQLDPCCCYAFELVSPDNRHIVDYPYYEVYHLASFMKLSEFEVKEFEDHTKLKNIKTPLVHNIELNGELKPVVDFVESRLPSQAEGVVIVDKNFNRVKVKSRAYLDASRILNFNMSDETLLELVLSRKLDDYSHLLYGDISVRTASIKQGLGLLRADILRVYDEIKDISDNKEFAIKAVAYPFSYALFSLRKGKDIDEVITTSTPSKLVELIRRYGYPSNEN